MKDRVFIVWSGTNKIAKGVQTILQDSHKYVCVIGGNEDNSSQCATVGDTVIRQIKDCNQAIIIFQNRSDNQVSKNLFFELGYVLASYGMTKVHCVRRASEQIDLPSDFDNSFVEAIPDEGRTDEEFAQAVVDYFMRRQKMDILENKMYLINNRYLIHDKIASHYSDKGSKCSDYELAQYLLFYMQASHLFGDEQKVYDELKDFNNKHRPDFSRELALAVNMALTFLFMVLCVKTTGNCEAYITRSEFAKVYKAYRAYEEEAEEMCDHIGSFGEWALVFIKEQVTYAFMLAGNSPELAEAEKRPYYQQQKVYGEKSVQAMEILEKRALALDKNDHVGLLALLRAYAYRNLFLAKSYLGEEDASDC